MLMRNVPSAAANAEVGRDTYLEIMLVLSKVRA